MKQIRFLAVILTLFFFLPLNAEAKVSRHYDDFSGYQSIASIASSKIGDLSRMIFSKGYNKGSDIPSYMLTLAKHSHDQWWFFSNEYLELKIDDEIESLPVYKSGSQYIKDNGYLPLYTYSHIIIPDRVINKLREAKSVILRVHFEDRGSIDLQVHPNILAEWKQVIAAEK